MADYSGYITGNNVENRKANALQEMLANFSMAQNGTPDTMLGFALGRWAHGLLDKYWAGRRDARLDKERQQYNIQQGLLGDGTKGTTAASQLMPDGTFDTSVAWASPYGKDGYNRGMMQSVIKNSNGSSEWKNGLQNAAELSDMGLLPKGTAANVANAAAGAAVPSALGAAIGSAPWGAGAYNASMLGNGLDPTSALGKMYGEANPADDIDKWRFIS